MSIFSFRAECQHDVDSFIGACAVAVIPVKTTVTPFTFADGHVLPDCFVELETDGTLEQLMDVIRTIQDGHVMLQTLANCPLSQNKCERNYSLV
jgi:hypothetical protein